MICKIDGCENKSHERGWCGKHYMRWYKYGNPNIVKKEPHGYCYHPLHTVWTNMKMRCYNKSLKQHKNYGGRGIVVCEEWKNNAKIFIEWCLENGWEKGLTIDRINNDGNYEPLNCRFVTLKENAYNRKLLKSTNTSGYCGVSWDKYREKWRAQIRINNKTKGLGRFNLSHEAALAYDKAITDNRPRNFS